MSGRELAHWDYYFALANFKVHVAMELVFRDATPDLETAKREALQYTWQSMLDRQARCGS